MVGRMTQAAGKKGCRKRDRVSQQQFKDILPWPAARQPGSLGSKVEKPLNSFFVAAPWQAKLAFSSQAVWPAQP